MAAAIFPAPFQTGFRLVGGEALNFALADQIGSSQYNMTAAGSTKAAGTNITTAFAQFSTVGSGSHAVLPAAVAGKQLILINGGANALTIDGLLSGDTIDGGATATLTNPSRAAFMCLSPGIWVSALLGAVAS